MKWISLNVQLPEVGKKVGLLEDSNGFPGYYAGSLDEYGDLVDNQGYCLTEIVGWWCEWPELP